MKYSILMTLWSIMMASCCGDDVAKSCPYGKYTGNLHMLHTPVNVVPHKLTYDVGDTIHFVIDMTDSIYDMNVDTTFLIYKFPFNPLAILWHFREGLQWTDGWRSTPYMIDSQNVVKYFEDGLRADGIRLRYTGDSGYKMHITIVPKEKGRYIFQLVDLLKDFDRPEYEKIIAYHFAGKCPGWGFYPVQTIVGDDHLSLFETELLYIDKKLYADNWGTIKKYSNPQENPYGNGGTPWEWNATYGFEVK